ncbi:MAG: hypothetical protein ACOY58_04260, partial [Candidatus Micrarchaeota archaeon]
MFGDDGQWFSSIPITPDFIESLTHYVMPRHFTVAELEPHLELSPNLLAYPDQGRIGDDLIVETLNQAYPTEIRGTFEVSIELAVSVMDPLKGELALT